MEALYGSRVSEESFCAAADPKELICYGSARRLAAGYTEPAGFFWSEAGSAEERVFYDSNQRNLRLVRFTSVRLQKVYLRATPEIVCLEFCIPNRQVLTWFLLDSLAHVNATHWHGKPHFEALWSRSAVLGRILIGRVVDQVWGRSRDLVPRCVESLKLFTA